MAHRRLFSALAWFALAAAGLVLLFPALFPEVHMPAVLAALPEQRILLGLLLSSLAGGIAVRAVLDQLQPQ